MGKRLIPYIKRMLKFVLITLLILILVLLMGTLILQLPKVQNYLADKAVQKVEEKTGVQVAIDRISVSLYGSVNLKGFFAQDNKKDTLLFAESLKIRMSLLKLLNKTIQVNKVRLENAQLNLAMQDADSTMNFSPYVKAFKKPKPSKAKNPEDKDEQFDVILKKVQLKNVRFSYSNIPDQNMIQVNTGNFIVKLNKTDLNDKMIAVNSISLNETALKLLVNKKKYSNESKPFPLDIHLEEDINLTNVSFKLQDYFSAQELDFKNVNLNVSTRNLDLRNKTVLLEKVKLFNANFLIKKHSMSPEDSARFEAFQAMKEKNQFEWTVQAGEVKLENNSFSLNKDNQPRTDIKINYADLKFNRISGIIENVELHRYHLSFALKDFSLSEKSGFRLNQLTTSFNFNTKQTTLHDFILETPHSKISQNILLQYDSVEKLQKDISHAGFELTLDSSWIGVSDLQYFLPPEMDTIPYISAIRHPFYIKTRIKAQHDTLKINYLQASYDSTSMSFDGYLTNYKQFSDSSFAVLKVNDFRTRRENITAFLPDSMLPDKMILPSKLNMVTRFEGTKYIFNTNTRIHSNYGDISVKTQTKKNKENRRSFSSEVSLNDFNLGKLLSNKTLGQITQRTEVSGTVPLKKYKDVMADVSIEVSNFSFLDYEYTDMVMEGTFTPNEIKTDISYSDSNLIFSLGGFVNIKDSIPSYDLELNLEGADLHALKLISINLKTRGQLKAKFSGSNINNSNGEIILSDLILAKDDQIYDIDSVYALLTNRNNLSKINLKSPFLKANYSGTIKPGNIVPLVSRHFSSYIPWSTDTTMKKHEAGQFEFSLKLTHSEMITKAFLPGLKSMLPIEAQGNYRSVDNSLSFALDIPSMEYNNISIKDFLFDLKTSDSTQLNYQLDFDEVSTNPVVFGKTQIKGKATSDSMKHELKVSGDQNETKYSLGVYLTESGSDPKLEFTKDGVILNYRTFNLSENSYIILNPRRTEFHDVRFYSDDQSLQIKNDTTEKEEYLIELSNFSISNLMEIVEAETELINGLLNGKVSVESREDNKLFNADLVMSDVFINKYRVFNKISLDAKNVEEDRIAINSKLLGDQDEIELNGHVSRDVEESRINMDIKIRQLNLDYFKEFTTSIFDTLSGSVHGNLVINGNLKSPQLNGSINLDDVKIKPDYLNTTFYIDDEKIIVDNNVIRLNRFALKDYQNNPTYVDGRVDFENFEKPEFELSVDANNFRFLNTDYQDGRLYYGKVSADLKADITGNPSQPNVDLIVNMENDSEFHFVIPELSTASIDEEGIVRFVDKRSTLLTGIFEQNTEARDSLPALQGTGINLTANIGIKSGMDIYIEIDPASNEELYINGNANLSFRKRRAETPTLNGRFEIANGTYTLTLYEVIRRTFTIQEGSYLMWNGNIQNPVTDITTSYQVRTSPVPLIAHETADFSTENTSKYSNNTPFLVNLNMEGNLLKPDLNFNLSTITGQSDALIQAKLAQLNQNESQLHKQVFSLLLFNSFIESTSASNKSSAYELNATARTSVSKLLTKQISSFADRYIKYFDLDVGVNSYYGRVGDQTSGQTEVSLDVSKRLFNDHLTVKLGGDFNVENRNNEDQNQNLSNIAGDVIIEYRIDEDGNYRIQGFNKTEYEDFFDGEVNKTGAAFIFNKDFYKLNELFKSDTSKNKKRNK